MYAWPVHLFRPQRLMARRGARSITGGVSISGVSQRIRTDFGGLWAVRYSGILLNTPDLVRAWRAWEAHLDDGATKVLVPLLDRAQAPTPLIGGRPAPEQSVSADTGDWFADEDRYQSAVIVASLENGAARGSVALDIRLTRGSRLKGGERFSLTHSTLGARFYEVERVTAIAGEVFSVVIKPPLRESAAEDDAVEFDKPVCVMRLAEMSELDLDLSPGVQEVAISFVEAF